MLSSSKLLSMYKYVSESNHYFKHWKGCVHLHDNSLLKWTYPFFTVRHVTSLQAMHGNVMNKPCHLGLWIGFKCLLSLKVISQEGINQMTTNSSKRLVTSLGFDVTIITWSDVTKSWIDWRQQNWKKIEDANIKTQIHAS